MIIVQYTFPNLRYLIIILILALTFEQFKNLLFSVHFNLNIFITLYLLYYLKACNSNINYNKKY